MTTNIFFASQKNLLWTLFPPPAETALRANGLEQLRSQISQALQRPSPQETNAGTSFFASQKNLLWTLFPPPAETALRANDNE